MKTYKTKSGKIAVVEATETEASVLRINGGISSRLLLAGQPTPAIVCEQRAIDAVDAFYTRLASGMVAANIDALRNLHDSLKLVADTDTDDD